MGPYWVLISKLGGLNNWNTLIKQGKEKGLKREWGKSDLSVYLILEEKKAFPWSTLLDWLFVWPVCNVPYKVIYRRDSAFLYFILLRPSWKSFKGNRISFLSQIWNKWTFFIRHFLLPSLHILAWTSCWWCKHHLLCNCKLESDTFMASSAFNIKH